MRQVTRRITTRWLGLLLCAVMLGTAPQLYAAQAVIEEVVVTGTKREQQSQDVPISVTAISEEMLSRKFRNDILAVGEISPGVTLGQVAGFRAIAGGIRGTGQNSILVTQDSSVVILVDDFALSNVQAQFVELFDVERIEVYRGPQGTLFGKSATGGAISIVTKRPVMNEYSADFEAQLGQFGGDGVPDDALIGKFRAAINVPLLEDKLAIRASLIYDYDDGFYTNDKPTATFPGNSPIFGPGFVPPAGIPTQSRGAGESLNGTDIFAGKVKVLWQPVDNYEAYFIYEGLRDRSDTVPGVNETPANQGFLLPLLGFPGIQEAGHDDQFSTGVNKQCLGGNPDGICPEAGHRVDVNGFYLHQTLDFEDVTFKLLTGYRDQEERLPSTYTGEAYNLFDATRNTIKENLQIELRGSTNFDGPVNFVGGFVHSQEDTDMLSYATVGLVGLLSLDPAIINDPTTGGAAQERKTNAFYLDGTWEFNEQWSFTAGFRWTSDDKEFSRKANPGGPCTALTPARDQTLVDTDNDPATPDVCLDARSNAVSRSGLGPESLEPFNLPLPGSAYDINGDFDDDWQEVTYRAVVKYNYSDAGMVYLSYATGFIPGGFTETCSSLATCQSFDSETNWNLELGTKSRFMDDTLQVNFAVFYTEYEDLVRSQVLPFTNAFGVTTQETVNFNAGKSTNWGVEGEITWLATENLQIDASFAYQDHEYDELNLPGQDPAALGVSQFEDLEVPFSPNWKWALSATYEMATDLGPVTWNLNANFQGESEFSVFNSDLTQLEARTLVDANVTWRDPEERYRITLWSKNLLDDRHRTAANSVAGLWNFTQFGRPRSFGVEVGLYFN